MPKTTLRAVIFDLDDTLFDHVGSSTAALRTWFPGLDAQTRADLTRSWFAAEERHFPAWRSGEISFEEQRRRRLRDVLPSLGIETRSDHELDAIFADFLSHYEASWRPFPDAAPALEAARRAGLVTAVLTNGTVDQQNAKIDAVSLRPLIDDVFTSEEIGAAKPNPAAYHHAAAALQSQPSELLFVGDNYDLDVLAPRRAGLQAIHLDRHGVHPQADPARITTLAELDYDRPLTPMRLTSENE